MNENEILFELVDDVPPPADPPPAAPPPAAPPPADRRIESDRLRRVSKGIRAFNKQRQASMPPPRSDDDVVDDVEPPPAAKPHPLSWMKRLI